MVKTSLFCGPLVRLALLAMVVELGAPSWCYAEAHGEAAAEEEGAPALKPGGVKMGDFSILNVHPAEGLKSKVIFSLYMEVSKGHFAKFEKVWGHSEQRFRSEVLTVVRLCELQDFQEADLHRFRRRLQLRLHRTLPELPLGEFYVTDFRYFVN